MSQAVPCRRVAVLPFAAGLALMLAFGTSAAEAQAPRPLYSYSFEESGGARAADAFGGPSARVVGARHTPDNRFGGALRFDGRRDFATVKGARALGRKATLAAWVRPRSQRGGWRAVVAAGGPRSPKLALFVRPRLRGAGALLRSGGVRKARTRRRLVGWTHLAATYDAKVLRLYVDGRPAGRRAIRGGRFGKRLRIGGSPGHWFAGLVDEVRVYGRALTGRQIRAEMANTPSPGGGVAPAPRSAIEIPVYTKDNPPPTPALEDLPLQSSVGRDGITWTFSEPERVGRFITGDPYVVGAATVTEISPAPTPGRNGSVKNLPPVNGKTAFDDRTEADRYDAGIRANPPVGLAPGDSLVSSISESDSTFGTREHPILGTTSGSPVRSVSVLTSVAAPQPPDAFRPSYAGGGPIYLTRNLRREILPRLTRVAVDDDPAEPFFDEYAEVFRRPWTDNLFFNFDSPAEYMPDYARELVRAVGGAGLLLTLDASPEQKEPVLVYFLQYGIDLHGLIRAGYPGWHAHGGHGSGRKFPIVLAGVLLDAAELRSPRANFGEDMQTMYDNGWTGANVVYAGHLGKDGTGAQGPYEHLQPRDWQKGDDGRYIGEGYRRCCTSGSWVGEALAARLIPGVQAAWGHPAFFDYVDRWMTEDDGPALAEIRAQLGDAVADDFAQSRQREASDPWVTNMWRAYR
jgi:hypothetical protein